MKPVSMESTILVLGHENSPEIFLNMLSCNLQI